MAGYTVPRSCMAEWIGKLGTDGGKGRGSRFVEEGWADGLGYKGMEQTSLLGS